MMRSAKENKKSSCRVNKHLRQNLVFHVFMSKFVLMLQVFNCLLSFVLT